MSVRAELERLDRVARADGMQVVQAEDGAQAKAWGGALALFDGAWFRFAANSPDTLRAWLHVNGTAPR